MSETHLKDKPNDIVSIEGYNIEYTNRIGREKGACACLYLKNSSIN